MAKTKINKLPKSEVEIEATIEADVFESYFDRALKHLGEHVEIKGFRKGKVPENILLTHVGEMRVLEEMADMALSEHYPKIVTEEKLDVISHPTISITKLARKNPLEFKIKTAIVPEIKLPDYKKIAKDINAKITEKDTNPEVSDKEMEDTIMDIRKSRAPKKNIKDAGDIKEVPAEELPEFNDDFVKALGPFENVEDFKTKLKENIRLEKINQNKEKNRLKIIESIIEKSEIDLPDVLVDAEVDKILYKMESDITQMGLKFEEYLKHLNKKVEDLREEFKKDGDKRARLGLVLAKIAETEKITADEKDVEKEVKHLMEHYKDADPERAKAYVENIIVNEAIFKFLEEQQ